MRRATLLIVFLITLAVITTSAYALEPSEPHDANAMWIEPSTIDISGADVGYKFNVTVWANASVATECWQIWLIYPSAYINATRAGYTNGSKSEFFKDINTYPVDPIFYTINATHKDVEYTEAWIGGPFREPGYGSLCWIEFEVIALPPQGTEIPLDIQYAYVAYSPPNTFLQASDDTYIPLNVYNAVVVPELGLLAMLALLAFATPTVLYAYKKKR